MIGNQLQSAISCNWQPIAIGNQLQSATSYNRQSIAVGQSIAQLVPNPSEQPDQI